MSILTERHLRSQEQPLPLQSRSRIPSIEIRHPENILRGKFAFRGISPFKDLSFLR